MTGNDKLQQILKPYRRDVERAEWAADALRTINIWFIDDIDERRARRIMLKVATAFAPPMKVRNVCVAERIAELRGTRA